MWKLCGYLLHLVSGLKFHPCGGSKDQCFRIRPLTVRLFALGLLTIPMDLGWTSAQDLSAGPKVKSVVIGRESTQETADVERLEVEAVTLYPWGFEPREIRRPEAPFILLIFDYSNFEQTDFSLRATGAELERVSLSNRRVRWADAVDLAPGEYALTDSNRPELSCVLTITSR